MPIFLKIAMLVYLKNYMVYNIDIWYGGISEGTEQLLLSDLGSYIIIEICVMLFSETIARIIMKFGRYVGIIG